MSALLPYKNHFISQDSLTHKISFYHVLVLMASLPFDRFYSHLILISFGVHTVIHLDKQALQSAFTSRMLLPSTVYLATILSTIYTTNLAGAFKEWTTQVPVLIVPALFYLNGLNLNKYRSSLMMGFSMVCTATVFYLYTDAFLTIRHFHLSFSAIFSVAFTNHNFSKPIDMHATFFSMQLGIALVYLISCLIGEDPKSARFSQSFRCFHLPKRFQSCLYVFCILILCAGLIQLSAKSIFFCLILVVGFIVPLFLLSGSGRWKYMLLTGTFFLVAIAFIYRTKTFKERYVNELKYDLSEAKPVELEDPRLARWETVMGLIAKKPLIGYGAGGEINLLHQAFFEKKQYNSYLHQLNAHSQYLSFLLKSGIVGLLVYLFTITLGFKLALDKKDLLFLTFIFLIAFVSISENLLDVDKGIFFYAVFFSFFLKSLNTKIYAGH